MYSWELAILEALYHLGDKGSLQQVNESLKAGYPLSEAHLRETQWGGRAAYKHQVRSHLSNLYQKGNVVRLKRGYYALTHQGKQRFLNEMASLHPESPVVARER